MLTFFDITEDGASGLMIDELQEPGISRNWEEPEGLGRSRKNDNNRFGNGTD